MDDHIAKPVEIALQLHTINNNNDDLTINMQFETRTVREWTTTSQSRSTSRC
jgi:hypothetical protein